MGGLEAVLTGLGDILRVKKYRYGRELLTAAVVFAAFCIALPNVTCVSMPLLQPTQRTQRTQESTQQTRRTELTQRPKRDDRIDVYSYVAYVAGVALDGKLCKHPCYC